MSKQNKKNTKQPEYSTFQTNLGTLSYKIKFNPYWWAFYHAFIIFVFCLVLGIIIFFTGIDTPNFQRKTVGTAIILIGLGIAFLFVVFGPFVRRFQINAAKTYCKRIYGPTSFHARECLERKLSSPSRRSNIYENIW
jgi:lipopolysaccharide export LptBFGC system permease protein LptF